MYYQRSVPATVITDVEKTYYGKFLQNEEKIRNLANVNRHSYAAVVVEAADHFTLAGELMKEHLRASELFAIWTPTLRGNLIEMANDTLKSEGSRISDLDRDARVCYAMLVAQENPAEAIIFLDICKKKYPTEVFFHRIYCDLFLFTMDVESGIKACELANKLFPNNANILHARAFLLRKTADAGAPDYRNWAAQRRQIEIVKEAYKDYLKVAPRDDRQFAENNYVVAYLSLQYSTPSPQISTNDILEISFHFQNGRKAELDILPCFLPFFSETKEFVSKFISIHPTTDVHKYGNTSSIDITTPHMPVRPTSKTVPTDTSIDMRVPTKRRIDISVPHRQLLKDVLSDPAFAILAQLDCDENMNSTVSPPVSPVKNISNDFEEIFLYQMTFSKVSEVFTSKVIQLTVAEDSLYSNTSGFFEMVVADTTGDVIKLLLDLGTKSPENHVLKELMKKFRFGTVWNLRNPDFHMENGDEMTMYIRTTRVWLIPTVGDQNGLRCRTCFKLLEHCQHCAKCKRAAYCGKECQEQDWKYIKHNLICSEAYKDFFN